MPELLLWTGAVLGLIAVACFIAGEWIRNGAIWVSGLVFLGTAASLGIAGVVLRVALNA